MKSSKHIAREELNASIAIYLNKGNHITKFKTEKTKKKSVKEDVVEIEVECLPKDLQDKYFGA